MQRICLESSSFMEIHCESIIFTLIGGSLLNQIIFRNQLSLVFILIENFGQQKKITKFLQLPMISFIFLPIIPKFIPICEILAKTSILFFFILNRNPLTISFSLKCSWKTLCNYNDYKSNSETETLSSACIIFPLIFCNNDLEKQKSSKQPVDKYDQTFDNFNRIRSCVLKLGTLLANILSFIPRNYAPHT